MLIYAEAHTHTAGFDSQTQAALNELRDRCGMPDVPTSLSKEEGLELIAAGQYQVRLRELDERLSVSRRHLPSLRECMHQL